MTLVGGLIWMPLMRRALVGTVQIFQEAELRPSCDGCLRVQTVLLSPENFSAVDFDIWNNRLVDRETG